MAAGGLAEQMGELMQQEEVQQQTFEQVIEVRLGHHWLRGIAGACPVALHVIADVLQTRILAAQEKKTEFVGKLNNYIGRTARYCWGGGRGAGGTELGPTDSPACWQRGAHVGG